MRRDAVEERLHAGHLIEQQLAWHVLALDGQASLAVHGLCMP
jgi:hypothetical protein